MGLLDDYSNQALAYDRTRGASRTILGLLRKVLAAAPGPRLIDIGGGTGNYAAALREGGFRPLVVDRSAQMLTAAAKGLDWRAATSYYERMESDHPAELERGLARLAREVREGCAPTEAGRFSLLSWIKARPSAPGQIGPGQSTSALH